MKFQADRKQRIVTISFLLIELILYLLILTTGGTVLVASSFVSIVVCFLYSLLNAKQGNRFIIGGLACTVMADYCLVVCSPVQRLWGMLFFMIAQTFYAIMLHRKSRNRKLLFVRAALVVLVEIAAVVILKDKLDALTVVSVYYYANLIVNLIQAFTRFRDHKLLPIGFVLFLLCDTVIGLQVASGAYLPIGEDSLIYRIIFMDFHLSWFFYLPSQVLISLCSRRK